MIGEATYIACRHKQQLLPSTKQELPAWIYVRGKVQFKSMCCLEGIECSAADIYTQPDTLIRILWTIYSLTDRK
jgi:hypothetical protein